MALQALPGKSFAAEGQAGNSAPAAGGNTELVWLTLTEAAARLRVRQVTSVELTEACLERIEIYNRKLDAFITVTKHQALATARQADAEIKAAKYRGVNGPMLFCTLRLTITDSGTSPHVVIRLRFRAGSIRFRCKMSQNTIVRRISTNNRKNPLYQLETGRLNIFVQFVSNLRAWPFIYLASGVRLRPRGRELQRLRTVHHASQASSGKLSLLVMRRCPRDQHSGLRGMGESIQA